MYGPPYRLLHLAEALANLALDANVTFVIFTFAEGNIAIAAACMPLIASQWQYMIRALCSSRSYEPYDTSPVLLNHRQCRPSRDTQSASNSHGGVHEGSQGSIRSVENGTSVMIVNSIEGKQQSESRIGAL